MNTVLILTKTKLSSYFGTNFMLTPVFLFNSQVHLDTFVKSPFLAHIAALDAWIFDFSTF